MVSLLIILIVIGVLLYVVENFIPMSPPFKIIIRLVALLIVVIYLLRLAGIDVAVPK
jgi:hypothetical protein